MHIQQQNFTLYLAEIRNSLQRIRGEVVSDKSRDEVDCMDRILCLMEAEHSYLNRNQAEIERNFEKIISSLESIFAQGNLTSYKTELDILNSEAWRSRDTYFIAQHNLFQNHLPEISRLAFTGNSEARNLIQVVFNNESEQFEKIQELRQQFSQSGLDANSNRSIAGTSPTLPAIEKLQDYLKKVFPSEKGLIVKDVKNIPGGRSKDTAMIGLESTRELPPRLVMRRDIEGGLVPSRTQDEYGILKVVEKTGEIPVPKTYYCEPDKSIFDGSFILVEGVSGSARGEFFPDVKGPTQHKEKIGRQLARILARLHQIDLVEFGETYLDLSVDLKDAVQQTIESTYKQASSFDTPSRVHIELAYQWLSRNIHLADDNKCVIHCDIGLHNMLIDDKGDITALLDWELACVASPAREIAKILHLIDFLMPRHEFMHEYLNAGGAESACDTERLGFYAIMNYMVTTQRSRYGGHLFHTGAKNIVRANSGYDFYYRCVSLLANSLKQAYPA